MILVALNPGCTTLQLRRLPSGEEPAALCAAEPCQLGRWPYSPVGPKGDPALRGGTSDLRTSRACREAVSVVVMKTPWCSHPRPRKIGGQRNGPPRPLAPVACGLR